MPKLYTFAGEWSVPGKQPRHARRVDIPNSPAELAAWLNERRVPVCPPVVDVAPLAAPASIVAPPAAAGPLTLTDVEEFIQAADPARLASLAQNVCYRMAELARGLN